MSETTKQFKAGVPTDPDVALLDKEFGIPDEGTLIPWERIERAIGIRKETHRFRTVTHSWRARLYRKHNVYLAADPGKGLVRPPPDGRIECATQKINNAKRGMWRGIHLSANTDRSRLSPENRKAAERYDLIGANFRLADAASAKGIAIPSLE